MAFFLQFLNFVLSRYVAQVLSEWFWNGSSRPYYYRYQFCFHIPHALSFWVLCVLKSSRLLSWSHFCLQELPHLLLLLLLLLLLIPILVKIGEVHPRTGHEGTKGAVEVWIYSFFILGAGWGGWSSPRSGCFTPGKETRYPLYRRLGGSQGRSGRMRKLSPPPELDLCTVQSVAIRCPGPKLIWMFVPISAPFIEIGTGVFILCN